MQDIGRNEECPCGSRKKYKKCCILNNQVESLEFKRRRMKSYRADLIKNMGRFTLDFYGPEAIDEAYEEFHLWEVEDGFDPDSEELPIFMPFFYYLWTPDPETMIIEDDIPLLPPALLYILNDQNLTTDQKNYLHECCQTGLSFYEVLNVEKGKSINLKNLLTGSIQLVYEKLATENIRAGDILFGQVICVDGIGILEACAPIIIPPQFAIDLIDLKKLLKKKNKVIDEKVLIQNYLPILEYYRMIYNEMRHPRPKILSNSDGHLLVPHKMIFEIEDSNLVFDALHSLDFADSREDLLSDAKLNKSNGQIELVEFPWLKKSVKNKTMGGHTVNGHIKIENQKMTVEVNSKERAKKFQTELKKRLKEGWKLKATLIEPLEAKINKKNTQDKSNNQSKLSEESNELMNHPEVKAHLEKMMKNHWDNWIYNPIPALDGKSPIEALKSKIGKEKLRALLNQFERNAERNPMVGQTVETIKDIREKLGI